MPSKRKRTGTNASTSSIQSQEETIQHNDDELIDKKDGNKGPPSKRSRSNDGQNKSSNDIPQIVTNDIQGQATPHDNIDKTEGEDSQGDNNDVENPQDDLHYSGENGEASKMRMAAVPKAGMVDPVGFKTNPPPEGRPVRIYADGVFDLFHCGHMRQLQQAKTAFPSVHLIVGVTGDAETNRRKGLTVLSATERAESVRHCKWVDEVVEDCPWIVTAPFLAKHSIDYVAHDDIPYGAAEGDDIYGEIKKLGKFLVTQRTEGVSTTGIITKIVRDYESYIARQLQRGQSRKELNISWLKKNELDIKRHVNEIRDSIKQNWTTTGHELGKEFRQYWMPAGSMGISRPGSPAVGDESIRRGRKESQGDNASLTSPTASVDGLRSSAQSPGAWSRLSVGTGGRDRDFVAGYAMGLLGSVRGWMQRNRRTLGAGLIASPNTNRRSSTNTTTTPNNNRLSSSDDNENDEDDMMSIASVEDDPVDGGNKVHKPTPVHATPNKAVERLEDKVAGQEAGRDEDVD